MRLPSLSILWLLLLTTAHGGARAAEPDGAGSAPAPRVQRMVVTDFEIDAGMAYRFVLYHIMRDAPLDDIFRVESVDIGGPALH